MSKPTLTTLEESVRQLKKKITELESRQSQDAALSKDEKLFESIVQSVPDIIYRLDRDGKIIFINDSITRYGYSVNELIGKSIIDLVHSDDREYAQYRIAERRTGERRCQTFELRLLSKNERDSSNSVKANKSEMEPVFLFEAEGLYYNDDQDTVHFIGTQGIAKEITSLKMAEKALSESEELHRITLDNISDAIFITDDNGAFTYISPTVNVIFRYSQQDVVALGNICKLLGSDLYEAEELNKLVEINNIERTIVDRDGNTHILLVSIKRVSLKGGTVLYTCHDITEHRKTDEERLLLATIIEEGADSIIFLDKDLTIQNANEAFEELSGYKRQDVIDKSAHILLLNEYTIQSSQDMLPTLESGDLWTGNISAQNKQGEHVEFVFRILPILDSVTGAITRYVCVGHDISRELELEGQLLHAQKMEAVGTLAAGIAHDFNNILGAILLNTELSLKYTDKENKVFKLLNFIVTSVNRAKQLVEQILTFSRQGESEMKLLKLEPVIKEMIKFLQASLPSTISITYTVNTENDFITGDLTQIHGILVNLCNNSAQAMKDHGGRIEVSLDELFIDEDSSESHHDLISGPYVKLSVHDTGAGMDKALVEHIFEPFYTTRDVGDGTGLGLSVVHGIVKNHNGAITVNSEPGVGTTVNVYFPCVENEPSREVKIRELGIFGTERILFVDDELLISEMSKSLLEAFGYTVTSVTSGGEALDIFRNQPDAFDIVITDLTMPGMTGTELSSRIVKIRKDIPVLLCTGYSEALTPELRKKLGIKDVLFKPVSSNILTESIRRVIDDNS